MATHSSILAWEIPWTKEPGGLQSIQCQRVGHDLMTKQQQKRKEAKVMPFSITTAVDNLTENICKSQISGSFITLLFFNMWIQSGMPQKPLLLSCLLAFSINPAPDFISPFQKNLHHSFGKRICFALILPTGCLPCVLLHINSPSILKSQQKEETTPAKTP